MNRLYHILLGMLGLMLLCTHGYGQLDRLSDQDLDDIENAVQECFSDYETTMKDLTNPTLDNRYRDAIVSDGKKSFVDGATIAVDYDSSFIPPFLPNDKEVGTYLTDFNVFFKEHSFRDRIKIYYTNRKYSKVMWNEKDKYYYLTLHYTSRYGDQLPQKRTATFIVDKTNERWKALITYIKFQGENREEELFAEKKILTEPEWRILARQAEDSLNNQNLSSAFALIQQSFTLDTTAFNLRVLGRYYQEKGELEKALENYEKSLMEGEATDTAYQDSTTLLTVQMIHEELEKQQREVNAKKKADSLKLLPTKDTLQIHQNLVSSSAFSEMRKNYKRGKKYEITWNPAIEGPVSLLIYRKDTLMLRQEHGTHQYEWNIPKQMKPGKGYHLLLQDPKTNLMLNKSGTFAINRRFPAGLRILVGVSVTAGILYIGEKNEWWDFIDNFPKPLPPPEKLYLPKPPFIE